MFGKGLCKTIVQHGRNRAVNVFMSVIKSNLLVIGLIIEKNNKKKKPEAAVSWSKIYKNKCELV